MRPGRAIARMLLAWAAGCLMAADAGAQRAGGPLVLQGAVIESSPSAPMPPRRTEPPRPRTPRARVPVQPRAEAREERPKVRPPARIAARPRPGRAVARVGEASAGRPEPPAQAVRKRPDQRSASRADWAKAGARPDVGSIPAAAARPATPLPPERPAAEALPATREAETGVLGLGLEGVDDPRRPILESIVRVAGQPTRWVAEPDLVLTSVPALRRAAAGPDQVAIVANLFIERAVLVAGAGVGGPADLGGRPLAVVGPTARLLADDLVPAPSPKPDAVALPLEEALARLGDGRVDALLVVTARPAPLLARLPEGTRPVPLPFTERLRAAGYYPATIEAVARGSAGTVETLAVGTALVAKVRFGDGGQEHRLAAFVEGFFSNLEQLGAEDPRWREVNVAAEVAPWPRLEAARRWLAARGVPGLARPSTEARAGGG